MLVVRGDDGATLRSIRHAGTVHDVVPGLIRRWGQLARRWHWPEPPSAAVRDDLLDRYRQAHRRYHTLAHLSAALDALDALAAPEAPSPTARLAVWFHDAVYEGVAGDDEEASARLAEQQLAALGTPPEVVATVGAIVRATAGHTADAAGTDPDTALVLDADLSILAADQAGYDRYVEQVRAEHAHVPHDRFVLGRRAVVAALLGRHRLYLTPAGAARFEAAARANLTRELDHLGPPIAPA